MNLSEMRERARIAAQEVRALALAERLRKIVNLKSLVLSEREAMIDRIQKDTSKSRTDALMSEIFPVLEFLDYLEKNATGVLSKRKVATPLALMGKKSWVEFAPLGTILVISPWNYPFFQAMVPIALSFVCGNSTLYKPSEHTPLKGLVEDILQRAGFSPDWVQVAYGDGAVGAALIEEKPSKIFFTGSSRTGQKIMTAAAAHLIPVELELGGKDPMIVFEDADIKRAAAGATWGALTNSGQACTSTERLYVQKSIFEEFRQELTKNFSNIEQGTDHDGSTDIGSMTVDFQLDTVRDHLEDAKSRGGRIHGAAWDGKSKQIPPMLVEGMSTDAKILRDETFGPVLPIQPFETEEEVVHLANATEYGLSASVWSKDSARATRVASALEVGNVSINNVMLTEGNSSLPFGGIKQSGMGRYKGEFGFYSFTNVKACLMDGHSSKIEVNWYPYTPKKYQLFSRMMESLFRKGPLNFLRFALTGLRLESYSNKIGLTGRKK